jgi:TRAP-type C4-dicarboxylate transport system substrate-binding protein
MRSTTLAVGALASLLMLPAKTTSAQVTLNVSVWVPPTHHLVADVTMPYCADIQQATQSRVKCNLLPKSVVAAPQTFDAVRDGLADLSFAVHGYTPGRFALTDAVEFPFMGDSAEAVSVAYQRIYEKMLAKHDEHKGAHVLAVFSHGPGQIFNTRRPISSLKDLEGLKIRVGGGVVNDVAKALGAVPMLKPAPESYELLSQGVADGVFFPKEAALSFRLIPLIKHATFVPGGLYNVSFVMLMNPAKWNQISEADRAAINKLSGEALARRAGKGWDAADAKSVKAMHDANIPIVTAGPQFVAEIKSRTEGLERAWIDKVKGMGVDGAAVLAALRSEIAGHGKN